MKKLLMLVIVLFSVTLNVQSQRTVNSSNSGHTKVKKEKTNKMGILVKGGTASYSLDGWNCESGYFGEAFFTLGGPMKPRNPECRWLFETGLGIDFYSGTMNYTGGGKGGNNEEVLMIGLFTIPVTVKYLFNPLSTRGKWYAKGGMEFCPFEVGVFTEETSSRDYHHLGGESIGFKVAADAGLGYESKHWGASIGAYAGIFGAYSADSSSTPSVVGLYASIQYLF